MDKYTRGLIDTYLNDGQLSLCWDIVKSYNKPEVEEYFWSNFNSVKQIHLHDVRNVEGKIRSHRVIGSGEIEYCNYLKRFQEADILDYCIEVRPREKALESLKALRLMC